jgi:hypothetical protein
MDRVILDDGRWVDLDACERFEEETYWDGRNMISRATGEQFRHETLYRTPGGKWIVERSSQWQGERTYYREVGRRFAAAWLLRNGYEVPAELEADLEALHVDAGEGGVEGELEEVGA